MDVLGQKPREKYDIPSTFLIHLEPEMIWPYMPIVANLNVFFWKHPHRYAPQMMFCPIYQLLK